MTATYAIDVGGSHVSCAIVDRHRVIARETIAVTTTASFIALLPAIEAALRRLEQATDVRPTRLGIAFPALLDPFVNRVLSTPAGKFEDAVGFDFDGWVRAAFDVPVRIELDGRVALLGEWVAGAAQGCDDVVMLTIGTGLGTAVIAGGKLLRGRHFQAGVLGGHLSISRHGRTCICGGKGCLEAEASTWALAAIAAADGRFATSALSTEASLDFAVVFAAASAGDRLACDLRDRCVDLWCVATVNLVHAYDPELIVIAGGVMAAADAILPAIVDHVGRHSWTHWGKPAVRAGMLGGDAPLIGAGALWEEVR